MTKARDRFLLAWIALSGAMILATLYIFAR
jgi:hypothetical protein